MRTFILKNSILSPLFLSTILILLSSCVDSSISGLITSASTDNLNTGAVSVSSTSTVMMPGESILFTGIGGTASYSYYSNAGTGYMNSTTGLYTLPSSATLTQDTVIAIDSEFRAATKNITIRNLQNRSTINFNLAELYNRRAKMIESPDGSFWLIGATAAKKWSVYKSTDQGVTFTSKDVGFIVSTGGITDFVIHPTNPLIMYAAGVEWTGVDQNYAGIIRRSIDGGETWTTVYNESFSYLSLFQITVLPSGDALGFLSIEDGSSDGATQFSSTVISGITSFTQIGNFSEGDSNVSDTYFEPKILKVGSKVYRKLRGSSSNNSIYSITNGVVDGSYTVNGLDRVYGLDADLNGYLYASGEIIATNRMAIARSTDGGTSWSIMYQVPKATFGVTFENFKMNSLGHYFISGAGGLLKSINNGTSFYKVSNSTGLDYSNVIMSGTGVFMSLSYLGLLYHVNTIY